MALAFHEAGPLRQGPFVFLDCERQESVLREALEAMLTHTDHASAANPVLAAWGGTLHLDSVERLGLDTQRLLLCLVHQLLSDQAGALRLSVGAASELERARDEGRFLAALFDGLNKIRFELDRSIAA